MALEFGFYDSMNGDRKYNAEQMSGIFEGLVNDGVYASVGDKFFTTPGQGLQVIVGTGRAWFHSTWNKNKAAFPLDLDQADPAFDRIDSVCLQVNAEDAVRSNSLMIVKGSVAVNPEQPIFPSTSQRIYWLRLANVRVRAGTTTISASDIDIRVGSSDCPFVTSIVQQTNIDTLFASWDQQFNDWWDTIKAVLDDNIATNLQNQIDALGEEMGKVVPRIGDLALSANSSVNFPGTWEILNGTSKSFSNRNNEITLNKLGINSIRSFKVNGTYTVSSTNGDDYLNVTASNKVTKYMCPVGEYPNQFWLFLKCPSTVNAMFHLDLNNGCKITKIMDLMDDGAYNMNNIYIVPIGTAYTAITTGKDDDSDFTFKLISNSERVMLSQTPHCHMNYADTGNTTSSMILAYYKVSPTETWMYVATRNNQIDIYSLKVTTGNVLVFADKNLTINYKPMYVDNEYIYVNRDSAPFKFRVKIGTSNVVASGENNNGPYYFKIPWSITANPTGAIYKVPEIHSLYVFNGFFTGDSNAPQFDTIGDLRIYDLNTKEEQVYVSNMNDAGGALCYESGKVVNLKLPNTYKYGQSSNFCCSTLLYSDYGVYFLLTNARSVVDTGTGSTVIRWPKLECICWKLPTYDEISTRNDFIEINGYFLDSTVDYNNRKIPFINFTRTFDIVNYLMNAAGQLRTAPKPPMDAQYRTVYKTNLPYFFSFLERSGNGQLVVGMIPDKCDSGYLEHGWIRTN